MKRLSIAIAIAASILAGTSHVAMAQFKSMDDTDPRAPKTGRTSEGLKADAEVDKLYREKVGHPTPNVKADPWGDVRAPSAGTQPASKAKQKQP